MKSQSTALLGLLLVILAIAAHGNSINAVLVHDGIPSIAQNADIRDFFSAATSNSGNGLTTDGRPLLSLSFYLNYCISENAPWSYQVGNLLIHIVNSLLAFGICKNLLRQCAKFFDSEIERNWCSFSVATLWAVHPLTTKAVVYTVQRAESLASMFYLLGVFAFLKFATSKVSYWAVVSLLAFYLGIVTKEIIATLPIILLLYDRFVLSDSLKRVLKERGSLYVGYLIGYAGFISILCFSGSRGGTVGGHSEISRWQYLTTQAWAIVRYVQLFFWPSGLTFSYGTVEFDFGQAWMQFIVISLVLLAAVVCLWSKFRFVSLAVIAFFLILAPSSSIVPIITETISEHRVYLPSLVLAMLTVVGLFWLCKTTSLNLNSWQRGILWALVILMLSVAIGLLAVLTHNRNKAYFSNVALWTDTVEKMPADAVAIRNLAAFYRQETGDLRKSLSVISRSIDVDPSDPKSHGLRGVIHRELGEDELALRDFTQAITAELNRRDGLVDDRRAFYYLMRAELYMKFGNLASARNDYEQTLQYRPNTADALLALGNMSVSANEPLKALNYFSQLVAANRSAENLSRLGLAKLRLGDLIGAEAAFLAGVDADSNSPESYAGLAYVYFNLGEVEKARLAAEKAEGLGAVIEPELLSQLK